MKKTFKLLGATALLATIIPLSAYAATQNQTKTLDTAAPVAAVATQLQKAAKITEQQAIDAALKEVNGTVKKVELEDENGVAVYEVQIVDANGKGFEVKVDAATGKITKVESDNDESDNDEN
jgi:uncharacterized membrane protein YkoI